MNNIVCLIGSSRFKIEFEEVMLRESLKGNIVLSLPIFSKFDKIVLSEEEIIKLKQLHKEKIKIASKIIVINKNNYIGNSTKAELLLAHSLLKKIEFYE